MQKMSFSTKNYEGSLCKYVLYFHSSIYSLSVLSITILCTCINPYACEILFYIYIHSFCSPFVFVWFHFSLSSLDCIHDSIHLRLFGRILFFFQFFFSPSLSLSLIPVRTNENVCVYMCNVYEYMIIVNLLVRVFITSRCTHIILFTFIFECLP